MLSILTCRSKLPWLIISLASSLSAFAVTDEPPPKTEGTANPEAIPAETSEEAILSTIQYPQEMEAKLFAREPNVQDPTAITFDGQNRLYIAETHRFERGVEDNRRNPWVADDYQLTTTAGRLEMYKKYADKKPLSYFTEYSEKIRVVEDRDGDGKADHSQIFADGFNDPLDGTAAGVMELDGKIYFACIPHVWLLEDTDGDLAADNRESLQEGYGISVSLSGHDLNGFVLGPDNRIYFTIGDRGYNLKTKDGRHLYSQYEGAVFRMERDGSGLEVIHTGLRNPKEVAFDRYGNLFSVDNEADMQDMARVVDVVEGAHSGWQRGHQAFQKFTNLIYGTSRHDTNWMRERHWDPDSELRPRAILAPAGWVAKGPSGLAYNPGTGLAEKWDNHFFVCDFVGANSAVIGFRMEPNGAGFKVEKKENFVSGMLCTDIEFGYDSKAYVTDYVGSWPTHGFGNVFTFEDPKETAKPETKEVRGIFAKGFNKLPAQELAGLLRHPDMRVRLRAQVALSDDVQNRDLLLAATASTEPLTTRLHGVWGLGNLARLKKDTQSAEQLAALCSDDDSKVRGQAVKALGDSGHREDLDAILGCLADSDLRTRMLAAIATGKLGTRSQIPILMAVAKDNDDRDEYLRHGVVQGLIGIGDADLVHAFANSESPAIRRAVVLALRRFGDGRIGHFLKDTDLSIAVETVQAINDNYIEGARQDLAAATHLLGKSTWAVDLRILNAMIRAGGDDNARRLIEVASNKSLSENARTEALWLLGRFEKSPPTDPTTGMYRPIKGQQPLGKEVRGEIHDALLPLLANSTGNLLVEALGLAGKFGVEIPTKTLMGQLTGAKNPLQVRLAALGKLEKEKPSGFTETLVGLTADSDPKMRAAALQALGRISPEEAFGVIGNILASGEPSDQQLAIALLGTLAHPQAPATLLNLMQDLKNQPPAIHLDIIEAATKHGGPELDMAVADHEAGIDKGDPLAAFQVALEGGNPENGRSIFFNNGSANCRQCHKVGERGGDAGPNMAGIGGRHESAYILESIVNPSAKLAAGYSAIAVTMKGGKIVAGLLVSENEDEVVVRNMETNEETVCKRTDIVSIPPAISTMPPMGLILKKTEIRDLVAFLSSLK
ncbi:HEAT repeat domain-containing protein [Akkermansiaceae bacterium]|nr:HEAT repeat domain-containing protein [Akkermansiaceae bacterium]